MNGFCVYDKLARKMVGPTDSSPTYIPLWNTLEDAITIAEKLVEGQHPKEIMILELKAVTRTNCIAVTTPK